MQSTKPVLRLNEKLGEDGKVMRENSNLSDHLAEIFSIIFEDL